ncbi:MAG: RusA family crossover junction endodeoxyribonuclease [Bacteroidales bacterium]|nr:RusA family crossover junction endodeoxyribonuclease [Bacteroidales bacterium]
MSHIDTACFNDPCFNKDEVKIIIDPFIYKDGRKPRLPRKQSKGYILQKDTNLFFAEIFSDYSVELSKSKFAIKITITRGNDRLGGGDLDNYSKAILDGITCSKKIWIDDSSVDHLEVIRLYDRTKNLKSN